MNRKKMLPIALIAVCCLLGGCTPKGKSPDPMTHYLFAYFTNDQTEGQQVCYAVSENGLDFTPLNDGKPVIAADTISRSGGVRDPHLLRAEDGRILMSLTDMDMSKGKWTCRGIVLMQSDNLVNWKHAAIDFPTRYAGEDAALANAVWAPQTIYDPEVEKYMVYFSLHSEKDGPYPQDAVFYTYVNEEFTDLEGSPKRLFHFDGPTIDTDIIRDEAGTYHVFFNTWGGGMTGRRKFTATSLTDSTTWTLTEGVMKPEGVNMKSEGSSAYPLNDGSGWVLAYDCYADKVFHFCTTTDLTHFELVRETKTEGNFTPRHGSILPITQREYERLVETYKQQETNNK